MRPARRAVGVGAGSPHPVPSTRAGAYSPSSRKLELLCPSHRRVPIDVPQAAWAELGGNPCNPSVHVLGDDIWCVVRAVNYSFRGGAFARPVGDCLRSQNLLCRLEPSTYRVKHARWMRDRHAGPRSGAHAVGYEDIRLHDAGGKLWASATACDFSGGTPQIVLLHLTEEGDVRLAEVQSSGAGPDPSEKNWMPIIGRAHSWVYRTSPTVVRQAGRSAPSSQEASPLAKVLHGARGGSQLLPVRDGFLAVVHDSSGGMWRSYRHRFVFFSGEPLRATAASEPFVFAGKAIEFCCGMTRVGDRLLLSYGLEDCEAWLSEVSEAEVLSLLSESPPS
jgi:hypothetical protein